MLEKISSKVELEEIIKTVEKECGNKRYTIVQNNGNSMSSNDIAVFFRTVFSAHKEVSIDIDEGHIMCTDFEPSEEDECSIKITSFYFRYE